MPRHDVVEPSLWHGVIVAGGASRRFGSDKVFTALAGRRLIDVAIDALADAQRISVLLGSPERVEAVAGQLPVGCEALADDRPGCGPIGGLVTALRRHRDGWSALLAADMPLVPRSWWRWLAGHYQPGCSAIVPRSTGGRWEPLAALYHGSLADDLTAVIDSGDPKQLALHRWLDALDERGLIVAVDPGDAAATVLANVNRTSDAALVERLLAQR